MGHPPVQRLVGNQILEVAMDMDKIKRSAEDAVDKAKDTASDSADSIRDKVDDAKDYLRDEERTDSTLDKARDAVNKATGGRFAEHVEKARDFADDRLGDERK